MKGKIIYSGILTLFLGFNLSAQDKSNIVFIMSDDLNDWVGAFEGNPQALTPNIDRFCANQAMVFTNNHVPGPVCGTSWSAMLSSYRPETTGILRQCPKYERILHFATKCHSS